MTRIKLKLAYCPKCNCILASGQVKRMLIKTIDIHYQETNDNHNAVLVFQKLKEYEPPFDYKAHYKKMMDLIYYDKLPVLQS